MKVAIVFVGLLAMTCGVPSHNTNVKGVPGDLGAILVQINEAVAGMLEKATQAIADIQANVDQIREDAEAAATKLIDAALTSLNEQLVKLQDNVNEDAAKLLQCIVDQQPNAQTAGETASTAIIESIALHLNGIGDSLLPVVKDLQDSNAELNALDNQVVDCDGQDNENSCAMDAVVEVVKRVIQIPADIADDVAEVLGKLSDANEQIAADIKAAVADLTQANVVILNSVANCAAAN